MSIEQKTEFKTTILTGDRPTGPLHLGHYVGSLQNRLKLQAETDHQFLYMVADIQALTDNADNPQKVRDNVLQVALDNLAIGLDPAQVTMFIQSHIPEIAELTVLFLNLVTVSRLKRNPTVKDEINQKGYGESIPAGFLTYPVSQAADILFAKANVIPVGEDQRPMIEQTNEIAHKFNTMYGREIFPHVEALIGSVGRLVGTDGNAKASKSLGNAIYLGDSPADIETKVMGMYTDPNHVHINDPGQVEGNVVFSYLDIFDDRTDEVATLKEQYQAGGLGDVVLKKRLIEVLRNLLDPIRTRREELATDGVAIMQILKNGTDQARETAYTTMQEVRAAMKIDYFG